MCEQMRYRQCVCMLFLATPWTQNLGVRNFNKTSSKYKVNMLQPWLSKLFDQNFLWMYIYKKNQCCSKKHAQPRKLIILNNQDICCCVGVWNLTDESLLQDAFGQANCFPQFRTILKIILMQCSPDLCSYWMAARLLPLPSSVSFTFSWVLFPGTPPINFRPPNFCF